MAERIINFGELTDEQIREMVGTQSPAELETDIRLQQPTELAPTLMQQYRAMGIEDKIMRGEVLTPQEQAVFEQLGSSLAQGMRRGQQLAGQVMTETAPTLATGLAAAGIGGGATAGGAALGLLGGRLMSARPMVHGLTRLTGAVLGGGAGAELNQALGLEQDSNFSTGFAALLGGSSAVVMRIPKTVARGTEAARMARAQEATGILQHAAVRSITQEFERQMLVRLNQQMTSRDLNRIVNGLYTQVRTAPFRHSLDLDVIGPQLQNALRPESVRQIFSTIALSDRALATRFRDLMVRHGMRPPRANYQVTTTGTFTPEQLVNLRQGLTAAREAAFERIGMGRVATQIDDAVEHLDAVVDAAARGGNVAMQTMQRAIRAADLNFAQRGLVNYINGHKTDFVRRGQVGFELNIGRMRRDLDIAAEKLRQGEGGDLMLAGLARELERQPGGYAEFSRDLDRLIRLQRHSNVEFFGNTMGIVTRGAAIGAEAVGVNAMSELLMTPVGRWFLLKVLEAGGPTLTPPILSVGLTAARSAMSNQLQDPEGVIPLVQQYGASLIDAVPTPAETVTFIGQAGNQAATFTAEQLRRLREPRQAQPPAEPLRQMFP